jgi:GNAT superfamily N-acetyltransferase
MPRRFEPLLTPSSTDVTQIQRIYEANFPPATRKPLEILVNSGTYTCLTARQENEILAIAFLIELPNAPLAFLEYIAVDEAFQAQGIGSGLCEFMVDTFREKGRAVVWEIEPPSFDISDDSNRRLRFYERLGAKIIALSVPYAMPDYELRTGKVPLLLMQVPLASQPGRAEVTKIISGIYQAAYPESTALRDEILRDLQTFQAS